MRKTGDGPHSAGIGLGLRLVLLLAFALRLRGLAFGLPALLDPDEPTFVLLALKLLRNGTLNPGWFGHPGSTTIYLLAMVEAGVYGIGHFTGRFSDPEAFVRAIYADPSVVFLPGRWLILLSGLVCVWLTWRLAERLFGPRVGLMAAALLAIDPLHIRYSQIIRTDVQASMFVLLTLLAASNIARRGKTADFVLAGVGVGLACATKWPAVTVVVGGLGAWFLRWRDHPEERSALRHRLVLFGVAATLALFIASPYLLLDYPTVLSNLHGEERPRHLGATGGGPLNNLWWYVSGPLVDAFGLPALVLTGAGLALLAVRSKLFRYILLPTILLFLLSIIVQHLIWERWVVPLLPLLAIAGAYMASTLADWLTRKFSRRPVLRGAIVVAVAAALTLPPILTGNAQARERDLDTRSLATAWAVRHISAGKSVAIEYLAFDILPQPWKILFPAGERGCVDVRPNLAGHIQLSTIDAWRSGRAVVDLGNVAPTELASCRTDFVIVSNWDRYSLQSADYPKELATYSSLLSGGRQVAVFRPMRGRVGGPTVRVWQLPRLSMRASTQRE